MEMARYFVTSEGLSAAFLDPRVLKEVTLVLEGEAEPATAADLLKRGLIEEDRRPPVVVDTNRIIQSGALAHLREVLGVVAKDKKVARPITPAQDDADSDVTDLRTVPRRLYRLAPAAGKITPDQMKKLPSGARRVLAALRRQNAGTTKTLADDTGLNRRTVENALTSLRKAGLLETVDFDR
jgi:DNA-binding transcriptional ArsR family regulator